MPRYFSNTNIVGQSAPAALQSPPVTIAVKFWPAASLSGSTALASVCQGASSTPRLLLNIDASSNQTVRAVHTNDAATQGLSTSSTKFRFESWNSAVAVFASTSSRTAYCNGVAGPADTTAVAGPMTLDRTFVAGQTGATSYTGYLADACYWSAALTNAEIALYHAGVDPAKIRPANLVVLSRLQALPHTDAYGAVPTWNESAGVLLCAAPSYRGRTLKQKVSGFATTATVDLTVIGADLGLAGGLFDLMQLTSEDTVGGTRWWRRGVRRHSLRR